MTTAKEWLEIIKQASDFPKGMEKLIIKYGELLIEEHKDEVKKLLIPDVSNSLISEIRDEMDADMEDSGMAQGEIESCLNHWSNKYIIQRREWFSNDR